LTLTPLIKISGSVPAWTNILNINFFVSFEFLCEWEEHWRDVFLSSSWTLKSFKLLIYCYYYMCSFTIYVILQSSLPLVHPNGKMLFFISTARWYLTHLKCFFHFSTVMNCKVNIISSYFGNEKNFGGMCLVLSLMM
jgi:hypothetical protein